MALKTLAVIVAFAALVAVVLPHADAAYAASCGKSADALYACTAKERAAADAAKAPAAVRAAQPTCYASIPK